jgi:hypothetical protein
MDAGDFNFCFLIIFTGLLFAGKDFFALWQVFDWYWLNFGLSNL